MIWLFPIHAQTPDLVGPSKTRNEGINGEGVDLDLEHLEDARNSTVLFYVTLLYTKYRDPGDEPELHWFGKLKYKELADMACNLRMRSRAARSTNGR